MGIVHVAMYDAAVALHGGYRPYVPTPAAPASTFPEAAIATAAYDTLTGLQPPLGADQTILDDDCSAYLAAIPDGTAEEPAAKQHGIAIGEQVAQAILALPANDGRERNPVLADLDPPAPGPGVWQPAPGTVLGLRLPGIKPFALSSASQLRLAVARGLNLVQTARMLAMVHVAGGDAMIACFDTKYHDWFWRPYQDDPAGRHGRQPDPGVRAAPQHRQGGRPGARVLIGFHFRRSDLQGSRPGDRIGRYVTRHYFQRSGSAVQSSTAASSRASTGAPRPS